MWVREQHKKGAKGEEKKKRASRTPVEIYIYCSIRTTTTILHTHTPVHLIYTLYERFNIQKFNYIKLV